MAERVEPYDLGIAVRWEPNAPDAVLVADDQGRGALAQLAHPDDPDQRCVVLRWDGVIHALMGPPNDEARSHHPLYDFGLRDILWLGIVRESSLVARLRPMWTRVGDDHRAVPLHYLVVSKECVVEVLAETVDVFRIAGCPRQAAPASFTGDM